MHIKSGFIVYSLLLISSAACFSQSDSRLFSLELNVGSSFPIGKIASSTNENEYFGKFDNGRFREVQGQYHLHESLIIVGNLTGQIFYSNAVRTKLNQLRSGFKPNGNQNYDLGALTLGIRKNYFLDKNKKYCIFVNPNIGAGRMLTIFDQFYLQDENSADTYYQPVADVHWSPVIYMASGFDFTYKRSLSFNIKGNYMISNLGTEDIYMTPPISSVAEQILPDVDFGWAQRLTVSVGITLHLLHRKEK